jgi:O-antigen ligase
LPSIKESDRFVDGAFALAFAGLAWLVVFGHRGVAPCVGLMAVAAASRPRFWRIGIAPRRTSMRIAAAVSALFILWTAASGLWSPTPGALWLAATLTVGVLAGVALAHEASTAAPRRVRRLAAFFASAVTTAAAALLFEALTGGYLRDVVPPRDSSPARWRDLTSLARGATALVPLAFPAAVMIRRLTGSIVLGFVPLLALFAASAQFSVFANVVALAAGAFAYAAALAAPRTALRIVLLSFVAAALATPLAAAALPAEALTADGLAPPSWAQRLFIWREAASRALGACFPLGCGADYARAWAAFAAPIEIPGAPGPLPSMPIHPHNVFIQITLELGLPGIAAFTAASAAAAAAVGRAPLTREAAAAIAGALAATFISVMFEASLWQVWRLAVVTLAALGAAVAYRLNNS